ncbi:MAG: Sbal_3080 family lipoprotein [Methylococcales bacterium]
MKLKFSHIALLPAAIGGCSINQTVKPVDPFEGNQVCIVENPAIRSGFLDEYKNVLTGKGYLVRQLPPGSAVSNCPITSTYTANWRWDLALYMAFADIRVFSNGQQSCQATYDAMSGGANMRKFINGEEKIRELVDQLFPGGAKIVSSAATGNAAPNQIVEQTPQPSPSPLPTPVGEARTALVIGNARYVSSPLRTPQNDARALDAALRSLGFDVTLIENGTRRGLVAAIEAFGATLRRKGGVGLVFYAGHGVQIKAKNYLIPVDARVQSELTAVTETVDIELVLGTMAESGTRINILILDACRDNPFERRWRGRGSGLAPITASDAKGTLIAYSTDPGKTAADGEGKHSPYAKALIEVLRVPDLSIEQVFKRVRQQVQEVTTGAQTPWETSNLTGDFYFDLR